MRFFGVLTACRLAFSVLAASFPVAAAEGLSTQGVRINEFMASNGGAVGDGDGMTSDWIEIYNGGPGAADLSGWHLTDSAGNLNKWEFPAGTTLGENGFLLVFASGQESDDYVDAGGYLHTNFKLGSAGEYLALVRPDGETVVSEFAPAFPAQFSDISYGTFQRPGGSVDVIGGSGADVLVPSDGSLGLAWTSEDFAPDDAWLTGGQGSGVGYDGGPDYHQWIDVDVEGIMRGLHPSVYVRIPFPLAEVSSVVALSLAIRYDDGFVAYLNGSEIASRNAPSAPAWDSAATAATAEPLQLEEIDVTAFLGALKTGSNVLAIHGLNETAGSADFLVDPELIATLSGSGDVAFGYLEVASPGAPNTAGAAIPGPSVVSVTGSPDQPAASQDITVTAALIPRLAPVSGATLHYRVGYGAEVSLGMSDLGSGNFGAAIPASSFGAGDMVRWRVTARDSDGNLGKLPAFLDRTGNNQSPEYFGTVVADPALGSSLPNFQWFTQNRSASHTRSGTRASAYFGGRFYDNIFVRQRGGFTNAAVSQKFDFNKTDPLYVDATMPSVGEININGPGADPTSVRQPLAFDTHRAAGVPASHSALWSLTVNGGFDRVGAFIEQVDEDFLDRNGYDQGGDLYKFVQRSNLDPVFADTSTGIEKKTGDQTDLTSLQELVAGLNASTSLERRRYILDHLDLPQVINYLAVRSIIQDADDLRKNFYMYLDTRGDGRWRIFPWDKDFTFGVVGDGGTFLPHPFFGDEEHKKQNADQWNVLYDVVFGETTSQRLYLRRLRTLMDTLLESNAIPVAERYLESRAAEIIGAASPPLGPNISSIYDYLVSRRGVLNNNYPSLVPASQPVGPDVAITDAEHNPASGNQDQEYLVLTNREATEIDISGWRIAGGVDFDFAPGTVIERGGLLYVSPDTRAFRSRPITPTGGEEHLVVGPYSGHLSNFGEVLHLIDAAGVTVSSFTTPADPSDVQQYLVISEIMYHPVSADAEFIEVLNISDEVTLDLGGARFSAGIEYQFAPGTTLEPGGRFVVNFADFLGGTRLSNGGERLKLDDASGSTVKEFSYSDAHPWPVAPDGGGPSLVLIDPRSNPDPSEPGSWRPSTAAGGNPGTSDRIHFAGGDDLIGYVLPAGAGPTLSWSGGEVTLDFERWIGADAAVVIPEWSVDLTGWRTDRFAFLGESWDGTGRARSSWRFETGGDDARVMVRLRIELR
ncbi:lamin tail domain-containing protein [soil metagenome]